MPIYNYNLILYQNSKFFYFNEKKVAKAFDLLACYKNFPMFHDFHYFVPFCRLPKIDINEYETNYFPKFL